VLLHTVLVAYDANMQHQQTYQTLSSGDPPEGDVTFKFWFKSITREGMYFYRQNKKVGE
jgi:hypothetical protein